MGPFGDVIEDDAGPPSALRHYGREVKGLGI